MNIKYKDINAISYALCYADAMLDLKIEGRKKDNNNKLAHITGTFRTVYICWSDRPRENGGARYG